MIDLDRMLDKCRRGQWSVDDVDFARPPRPMSRREEMMLVQTFTDMAGIERLAGSLFALQRRRTRDRRLREIYASFIADEFRHARVAERLARHYDVHRYRRYRVNEHLKRFAPRLLRTAESFSPEVANLYITTGELLLDLALLRALDDACADPVCSAAMRLINRDEARHVAVDFHMLDHFAREPQGSGQATLAGWWAFVTMVAAARPFIRDVVVAPIDHCDPGGRRMREAFKRMQLAVRRPVVAERPYARVLRGLQWLACHPILGAPLRPLVSHLIGVDARALERLYEEHELESAREPHEVMS